MPSGRAVTRPVPPPHRRPRAPTGRRDRPRSSSGLNTSPQVRASSHRARAPPSRRSPRQAPCQRSATQLGEVALPAFAGAARDTSCQSLHLKPARHASACWMLLASDACPRRAACRASRPAALRTRARRPQRAELGALSAAPAPLTAVPWLPRSRSCEVHSVPLSCRLCRCCATHHALSSEVGPSMEVYGARVLARTNSAPVASLGLSSILLQWCAALVTTRSNAAAAAMSCPCAAPRASYA